VSFWRRKRREAELDDEVRSHLKPSTQEPADRGETMEQGEGVARRAMRVDPMVALRHE